MDSVEKLINGNLDAINSLVPHCLGILTPERDRTTSFLGAINCSPIFKSVYNVGKVFESISSVSFNERLLKSIEPIKPIHYVIPKSKKKKKNMLRWADFGWGVIDEVLQKDTDYETMCSVKDADLIIEKYLTEDIINQLIKNIKESKLNSLVFGEAVDCFSDGRYTSCILILYSIIDSFFLKYARIKEKPRPLSNKAAKDLIDSDKIKDLKLKIFLRVYVPLKAITVLFARGNDFTDEPDLANRNFISHGMNKRQVTKLDCVKALIILCNLIEIEKYIGLTETK